MKPFRLTIVLCCLLPAAVSAHSLSNSFIRLEMEGARITGGWHIAVIDLAMVIAMDANGDRHITWEEIRRQRQQIDAYALANLSLAMDNESCRLRTGNHQVDRLAAGAYLYLSLAAECPTAGNELVAHYSLLFSIDAAHRGILTFVADGQSLTDVFSPGRNRLVLGGAAHSDTGFQRRLWGFIGQGMLHIWQGADHLLFLLTLLLPLFLKKDDSGWSFQACRRTIRLDVIKTVTAFTLAHSLTLILAVLLEFRLPGVFVETFIALTIVIAGIGLLTRRLHGRHWQTAFALGLVHGLGFAGAVAEFSLTREGLATALLGFNLGVELGQLLIVLAVFPLLYAASRTSLYRHKILPVLSLFIVAAGLVWAVDRSLPLL